MASVRDQQNSLMQENIRFNYDKLPNLRLNPAFAELMCAFRAIEDDITTHVDIGSGWSTQDVVCATAEQYESLKKCPEHTMYFRAFDTLANNIGTGIINTFNILSSSVKPTVDILLKDIREKAAEELRKNEVVDENNEITVTYETADWKEVFEQFGGEEEVVRAFKEAFKFTPSLSPVDIKLAAGDRRFRFESLPFEISEELTKSLQSMSSERAALLVTGGRFFINELMNPVLLAFSKGMYRSLFMLVKNILASKAELENIDVSRLNVLDHAREAIAERIKTIEEAFLVCAYAALIARDRLLKNQVIVLEHGLLNGDVTADMNAAEISEEDITKFVRIQYLAKNRELPSTGIRLQDIVDTKVVTNEQFESDSAARTLRLSKANYDATAKAAEEVLTEYLRMTDASLLPANVSGEMFAKMHAAEVRRAVHRIDTSSDENLENVLYSFVIDLWHKGTTVETAHKLFGEAVIKQMSINNGIDEKDADLIDVSVAAAIAAEFLVDNLLITK